jgi:hypothetical protein
MSGIEVNLMKSKLIRNTDPSTASLINQLFDRGIITDFSEDGWVLYKKEWYPFTTFIERMRLIEHI